MMLVLLYMFLNNEELGSCVLLVMPTIWIPVFFVGVMLWRFSCFIPWHSVSLTVFMSLFANILHYAGISMTVEQWEAFRNAVPAIEDAIKKLEDSD